MSGTVDTAFMSVVTLASAGMASLATGATALSCALAGVAASAVAAAIMQNIFRMGLPLSGLFDGRRVVTVFRVLSAQPEQPDKSDEADKIEPGNVRRTAAQSLLGFGRDAGIVLLGRRGRAGCQHSCQDQWKDGSQVHCLALLLAHSHTRSRQRRSGVPVPRWQNWESKRPDRRSRDPGVLRDDCSSAPFEFSAACERPRASPEGGASGTGMS